MGSQNVVSWRVRAKMRLIDYKGGKCLRCGYDKRIPGAYDFHHRDPEQKDFGISGKTKSFEALKAEVDKCDLLCRRCHAEVHHEIVEKRRIEHGIPHLEVMLTCKNESCKKVFTRKKHTQVYCTKECYFSINKIRCKSCKKVILNPQAEQKYCSHDCMHIGRRKVARPSKEELISLINNNSMRAVGKLFNVSDNCIRKWCKKYEIPL
jgi:hypothetical protein